MFDFFFIFYESNVIVLLLLPMSQDIIQTYSWTQVNFESLNPSHAERLDIFIQEINLNTLLHKTIARIFILVCICWCLYFFSKKAEEAENAEKEKKAILNDLPEAILTIKDGTQRFSNQAAEKLLESIRTISEEEVLD